MQIKKRQAGLGREREGESERWHKGQEKRGRALVSMEQVPRRHFRETFQICQAVCMCNDEQIGVKRLMGSCALHAEWLLGGPLSPRRATNYALTQLRLLCISQTDWMITSQM